MPEQLRGDKVRLPALPALALRLADGDAALFLHADILREHAAPVVARAGVLPDLPAQGGAELAKLPSAEFCYLVPQRLLRVKADLFLHLVSSCSDALEP